MFCGDLISLATKKTYLGSRKVPNTFSDFNQIWISRRIVTEVPKIKFQENKSNGSRSDACRGLDRERHSGLFASMRKRQQPLRVST
jgi:hypothetical protein